MDANITYVNLPGILVENEETYEPMYDGSVHTFWPNSTNQDDSNCSECLWNDQQTNVTRVLTQNPLFDLNYRAKTYLSKPSYVIALILGFISISFNVLSILALFQIRNRLNTHYRLIISLAVSDALIGISIVLFVINKVIHISYLPGTGEWQERLKSRCLFMVIKALNTTSLNISLLNLMGMSMDHYIAITKPLRYHKLMAKGRAKLMIFIFWVIAFICGFSDFFSALPIYEKYKHVYNYCEMVFLTKYQQEYSFLVLAFFCLFVMMFFYLRIYWKVRKHRAPGDGQVCYYRKREEKHSRKALVTTLLILGSFILCWLPTCLFQIIAMIMMTLRIQQIDPGLIRFLQSADKYLYDILLLNCICDPIIYTVRCYEVRLGYRRLFRKFFKSVYPGRKQASKHSSFRTSFMTLPYGHRCDHEIKADLKFTPEISRATNAACSTDNERVITELTDITRENSCSG